MAGIKLKAFVLLESMFSMVIIMSCFLIAMTTFLTINNSSNGTLAVRARIALHAEAEQSKLDDRLIDEDIPKSGFTITKRIKSNTDHPELVELDLKALNEDGKILADYHEYIIGK